MSPLTAWLCWAVSIASVLVSYFLSRHALRRAIDQVDAGELDRRRLGGGFTRATECANVASGATFIAGVVFIACFAINNLEAKYAQADRTSVAQGAARAARPGPEARLPPSTAPSSGPVRARVYAAAAAAPQGAQPPGLR